MPIYEYMCLKCRANFERLVKNNQEKPPCVKCGSLKVERKLSVFAASVAGDKGCPARDSCTESKKHKCSGGCCNF